MTTNIRPITLEEGVKMRDFLSSFGRERLNELMYSGRPDNLSRSELLKTDSDAISRVASMHAGYDLAIDHLFDLASQKKSVTIDSGHTDMT